MLCFVRFSLIDEKVLRQTERNAKSRQEICTKDLDAVFNDKNSFSCHQNFDLKNEYLAKD